MWATKKELHKAYLRWKGTPRGAIGFTVFNGRIEARVGRRACISIGDTVDHIFLPPEVIADAEEYRKSLERILKFYTSHFRRVAERE